MANDTTSMEMNSVLEVANLVQVGKSILDCLGSETLSCPQKAQKLRDPVLSICRLLLAVKKDDHPEGLRIWVRGVSKGLCEASDLVDEAVADGAGLAVSSSLVSKVRCRSLFGLSRSRGNSLFGARVGPIINGLCQKLSELKQEAITGPLGLEEVDVTSMTEPFPLPVVTSLPDHLDGAILGRDEDREVLVGMLLDTRDLNHSVSVISIVGMGGIGKTTLAKSIHNDERIANHFDLNLWVCVGDVDFDHESILKSIISSCSAGSSRMDDLRSERLIDLLKVKISRKMFLLVLDDAWNEDPEKWASLLTLLQVGARGSKILVTTRCRRVASICSRHDLIYELTGLSDDSSWKLFKNITFGQLEPPENLVSIGRQVVRKCANVPLCIARVASFLRGLSVEEYQNACLRFLVVDRSVRSSPIPDWILWIYNSLPLPSKVCFASCSVFPRDHKISVIDLVSLWMAQGYIGPENSEDDLEDIAMQYFLTLSNSYLFINENLDVFGNIATCQMHDLVLDMAREVAAGWSSVKHFLLSQRSGTTSLQENWLKSERKLQSFFHWTAVEDEGTARTITINDIVKMSNFKSLRVLDLHAFGLQVLPDSIGNLVHLRYLDFSHNDALLKLPNSITNLYHLQTLKLNFCYELEGLPTSIGKLVHLRRLEIDGCDKLTFMPPSFKSLSSLRTLSRFVVGRPHSQFTSGFEALGSLNHLRGRLMVELSENWAAVVDGAIKSNLSNKSRITELGITWGPTKHTRETDTVQYKKLLDGLQPPSGLKMLQIEGYRGQDFPSWASGNDLSTALPNLITVSIDGCGECTSLPPFSRLPFLRHLSLRFMVNVQFFESLDNLPSTPASPFFPSLQELTLHSFYSLEGWWKEETRVLSASFSCLLKLKIWSCPKLTSMPLFPKVEVLDMQNINEKLLEFHNAWMTRSELQTSTVPSSSHSETSSESREHPQNLHDLRAVQIKSCLRLKTLGLVESSKHLKRLFVERLDMLSSLTEVLKQLTSLEELEVAACKDLDLSGGCKDSCEGCEECDVPWKFLSKLKRLSLRELPKLATLPVGLKSVKTLRTLCISTCNGLSTLPQCVSNLSSLQHLKLEGCPALEMLPEGLKDIKSLVKIDIIECPQLMERCREGGEDWHKIKHARVLCHKSWRYALMSETELSQKPKEKGKTIFVHSENTTIHSLSLKASRSTNEVALNLSMKTGNMKFNHCDF